MTLQIARTWVVPATLCLALAACTDRGSSQQSLATKIAGYPDDDGDGINELPPTGEITVTEQLGVVIQNDITRSDAIALARTNLPQFVTDSVSLSAGISVKLTYPGDVTQILSGGQPVAPFEIPFEALCPDAVEVNVAVLADIPVVGRMTVQSFGPFNFTQGTGNGMFTCGSVIRVHSFIDDAGMPNATTSVEAQGSDESGTGAEGVDDADDDTTTDDEDVDDDDAPAGVDP